MAQRDYVKKKLKTKNNSRVISKLMMVIAVVLVILFIAILYFISTNNTNNRPTTKPITEKPQTVLPEKPIERWTYLKALENPNGVESPTQSAQQKERQQILDSFINEKTQTNQVITNTQTEQNSSTQSSSWLLQCGAFKDKTNAESLRAKIAMLGVASFIQHNSFYRVFVGPFSSKNEGEKTKVMLLNNSITGCRVISK